MRNPTVHTSIGQCRAWLNPDGVPRSMLSLGMLSRWRARMPRQILIGGYGAPFNPRLIESTALREIIHA